MKSGWTIALVIAASLSAQTAVAAEGKQDVAQLISLLKLISTTSLITPENCICEALALTSGAGDLELCPVNCTRLDSKLSAKHTCSTAGRGEVAAQTSRQLLKFDIEVRGP